MLSEIKLCTHFIRKSSLFALFSIGLTGTNARPSIAPTFGVEPMMGTNPLTFGIPSTDDFPFVIDCATSVNQRGKIEKYAREGVPTPRGAVIDDQGIERTDTEGILRDMVLGKCALTPLGGAGDAMGGYKGKSCDALKGPETVDETTHRILELI